MDKVKRSWRPAPRRLVQLYSALLHNAYLRGFIEGDIYQGNGKFACAPGLNCYSCPGAAGACPLGALQNALASSGHRTGWYVLGMLLLFGVIAGRTVCGWLCPFGLLQELLHKIPTPKIKKSLATRTLSKLKYIILAVFVVALPLIYGLKYDVPLPAFCKYICPAGTFEGAVGLLSHPANAPLFSMLGLLFTRKFILMLGVGLSCVFLYRAFCRFLCPLGVIYGLFNRFSVIGVKVDQNRCTRCGACVRGCPMDVRKVGDMECIQCGKCVEHCSQGAISVKAGKITLKASEGRGTGKASDESLRRKRVFRTAWGAALAVLAFVLLWLNVLDPSLNGRKPAAAPAESAEEVRPDFTSDAPVGFEPGQQLADFSIACLDGSVFRLADTRGKVVFINLWATYCTPCVQELPLFDALYTEHGDDVAILAVHSSLVLDDPAEYLAGKDYRLPFAVDTEDDLIFSVVNGGPAIPQTVVLNRKGEVIYNRVGSVTGDMLAALYEQAGAEQ